MTSKLTKAEKKKRKERPDCWGCGICELANKKYGRCVIGACGCHLEELRT